MKKTIFFRKVAMTVSFFMIMGMVLNLPAFVENVCAGNATLPYFENFDSYTASTDLTDWTEFAVEGTGGTPTCTARTATGGKYVVKTGSSIRGKSYSFYNLPQPNWTDYSFTCSFSSDSDNNARQLIAARVQDENNFYYLSFKQSTNTNGDQLQINKKVGGTVAALASTATDGTGNQIQITNNTTYYVKFKVFGSTLEAYFSTTPTFSSIPTLSVTDADLKFGSIGFGSQNTAIPTNTVTSTFDDITVTPIVVGALLSTNSDIEMVSSTQVDSSNNTFVVHLTSGTIMSGPLTPTTHYTYTGLPAGLYLSANGDPANNNIIFTVNGTATVAMTSNTNINVVVNGAAVSGTYLDSGVISTCLKLPGTQLYSNNFEGNDGTQFTSADPTANLVVPDGSNMVYQMGATTGGTVKNSRFAVDEANYWKNYLVEADVKYVSGSISSCYGLRANIQMDDNRDYYQFYYDNSKNKFTIAKYVDSSSMLSVDSAHLGSTYFAAGTTHRLGLEVTGTTIRGYADGVLQVTMEDTTPYTQGTIALIGYVNSVVNFDNLSVMKMNATDASIQDTSIIGSALTGKLKNINNGVSGQEKQLIAAVYLQETNVLYSVVSQPITTPITGTSADINIPVSLPQSGIQYYTKLFLWDGLNSMIPYSYPTMISK